MLCSDIKNIIYRFVHESSYHDMRDEYSRRFIWSDHLGGVLMTNKTTSGYNRFVAHWRYRHDRPNVSNRNIRFIYTLWGWSGQAVRARDDNGQDIHVSKNHFSQTLYP